MPSTRMLTPGCSLVKVEGWDLKMIRVSTRSTEEQNQKMARTERCIACGTDKADGSATPGPRGDNAILAEMISTDARQDRRIVYGMLRIIMRRAFQTNRRKQRF